MHNGCTRKRGEQERNNNNKIQRNNAENFSNFFKKINLHIQATQLILRRIKR